MPDRVCIVTGAASGIGLAIVERLAGDGWNVVAVDRQPHAGVVADVTDAAAMRELIERTVAEHGRLDCYVNNAGVPMLAAPVEDVSDDDWDNTIAVNLTAFFLAARIVVPIFKRQGFGSLQVVASMAALRPRPLLSAYTAAKGGVVALAKQLAIELAETGIRVNAVCPVATDTPMLQQFGPPGEHVSAAATPMGRLARPEEIAATVAFLASDDASFITGSAIAVDGGRGL